MKEVRVGAPNDSRIVDTGKGLLGFHRLAIMGLTPEGMQPFSLGGSYAVSQRLPFFTKGSWLCVAKSRGVLNGYAAPERKIVTVPQSGACGFSFLMIY